MHKNGKLLVLLGRLTGEATQSAANMLHRGPRAVQALQESWLLRRRLRRPSPWIAAAHEGREDPGRAGNYGPGVLQLCMLLYGVIIDSYDVFQILLDHYRSMIRSHLLKGTGNAKQPSHTFSPFNNLLLPVRLECGQLCQAQVKLTV